LLGRKRAKDAAALRAWAAEHRFSYLASDDTLATAPWLVPLGNKSRRAPSHVLRGVYRDQQVLLLTLSSKTSLPGPEDTTQVDKREQGIYAIQLPRILSRIEVRPRYSVGDLAQAVRDRDEAVARGDFEGAYELRTDDAQLAARFVDSQLRAWLLETNAVGFTVVGDRLVYAGGRMDAGRIEYWLDYLCALLARIPPGVWDGPGAGPAGGA
jgi:hypothetical protein